MHASAAPSSDGYRLELQPPKKNVFVTQLHDRGDVEGWLCHCVTDSLILVHVLFSRRRHPKISRGTGVVGSARANRNQHPTKNLLAPESGGGEKGGCRASGEEGGVSEANGSQ